MKVSNFETNRINSLSNNDYNICIFFVSSLPIKRKRGRPRHKLNPALEKQMRNKCESERKRVLRNLAERNRQNRLSEYFNVIRTMLANFCPESQLPNSKVMILKTATSFIYNLIEDNLALHIAYQKLVNEAVAKRSSLHNIPGPNV